MQDFNSLCEKPVTAVIFHSNTSAAATEARLENDSKSAPENFPVIFRFCGKFSGPFWASLSRPGMN